MNSADGPGGPVCANPPSAGGVHYTKHIGPAFLAKQITGGYNNSDIFSNETELVDQYTNLDGTITSEIQNKLIDAGDKTLGTKLDNASKGVNNISFTTGPKRGEIVWHTELKE